jgi:hypothetical protein
MQVLVSIALAIAASGIACADGTSSTESKQYVERSQLTLSLFACVQYAVIGKIEEPLIKRLFSDGVGLGREFLKGVRANKVTKEDQYGGVASLWWTMPGTSDDFILGRIFEWQSADVKEKLGPQWHTETAASLAAIEFRKRNCELLRRP